MAILKLIFTIIGIIQILNIVFIGLSGILIGVSIGLGFFPRFNQPKNFKIQVLCAILGLLYPLSFIINLFY